MSPRAVRAIGLALIVAACARIALIAATPHLQLANDPADYQRLAVSVASGHGFGPTIVAPGGGPTAFRPPLWPLFLAALYKVVGVHVLAARAAEVVLGVGTVALVAVLGWLLAGEKVAVVAAWLAAVYPPLVLAGGSLLSESLSLPLELGSLAAALVAGRRSSWRWAALAGVLCGLDVLCRPDSAVLLVPAVLLAGAPRRWMRALVIVVPAALLTVTPWLARDAIVMGRFVPVTTQAGLVAAGTYNDTSAHDPNYPAAWRPPNLVAQYRPLLRGTELEEESALRAASLHYVRAHPAYPLRVAGWNTLRLFDVVGLYDPVASWGANGFSRGWAELDVYGVAGVGVLCMAGAAVGLRGRARPWKPGSAAIWSAPVLLLLVTVPLLGESRLRVSLDPFLLVLGAVTVVGATSRQSVAA